MLKISKISIKSLLNYTAIFIVFIGGFNYHLSILPFAQFRLSYLIIFIILLIWLPFLKGAYFNKNFLIILFILSAFSVCSMCMGRNTLLAFSKQFLGIFLNALFFYHLLKINDYDVRKLFMIYLNIAFVIALIGIIQEISFLVGFKPGYCYENLIPNWLEVPAIGGRMLKVNSILTEPAHFCNVMIPALFVSFVSFFKHSFKFLKKRKSIIIIAAFFLTFSASGYVAMFFAILLLTFNYRKPYYVVGGILTVCVVACLLYGSVEGFRNRVIDSVTVLTSKQKLRDSNLSTYALFSNALASYYSFKENPLFGSGLGSHEKTFERHIDREIPRSYTKLTPNCKDADSFFLRLVSETGLFGVAVFFVFLFRCYVSKKDDKTEYLWIISNAVLTMFFIKLLRMGHYFVDGFFFFFWMYYFAGKMNRLSKIELKKG